ncbi:MAG: serine hydrolase [Saprospiraceae bacterium]
MIRKLRTFLLLAVFLFPIMGFYPIDGYEKTGIKRLKRLELLDDEKKEKELDSGATLLMKGIRLHMPRVHRDSVAKFFEVDEEMQKKLNSFFPNLDESYSVTVMDITPGKPTRYAKRQEDRQFQPGSVGKIAVVVGFFAELSKIYPYSFEKRVELMKNRSVRAGQWGVKDSHTVPVYDVEKKRLVKRRVKTSDIFTLYEWIDHMLSVSNNGAAAIVWREAILMRVFGKKYPTLTDEEANDYFDRTPKSELTEIHLQVVNDPLRKLGIGKDEWRLGTLFTRGASGIIPPKGGSVGSPLGLMKFMVALERGVVVDYLSSLEIKRLMYLTDRRIRYASNKALDDAAVYFKSGSLYSCDRTKMPDCGKYQGNRMNYMNSVSIIERPDGTAYLVALMTNVLKRNSNYDHNRLAGKIDEMVRGL